MSVDRNLLVTSSPEAEMPPSGAEGEHVLDELGGGHRLRRVDGRIEVLVIELAAEAPHQGHPPPAGVGSPAEHRAVALAGVLHGLGVGLVFVPGRRRLQAELVVDVGAVPLDHRLGRQRQAERLALVLAVVLLALLEVGDVVLGGGRDSLVQRRHGAGGAVRARGTCCRTGPRRTGPGPAAPRAAASGAPRHRAPR